MSRYIDADAFEYELKEIEAITAMVHKNLGEDEEVGEISMPMFTIRNIMRKCAPIDIVRCKECSKRKKNRFCLEHKRYEKNDEGFCSYGERGADAPQTDNGIGCSRCEGRYDCYDRNMPHAVHCNNYGKITDEPQTERSE